MLNISNEKRKSAILAGLVSADVYTLANDSPWSGSTSSSLLSDDQIFQTSNASRIVFVHVNKTVPIWLARARDELNVLLNIPPNWDGHGAHPVQLKAASMALHLLSQFMSDDRSFPAIIPTNNGGLQLEWHRRGIDLEVRIEPSGHMGYYFEQPESGECVERTLRGDPTEFYRLVALASN